MDLINDLTWTGIVYRLILFTLVVLGVTTLLIARNRGLRSSTAFVVSVGKTLAHVVLLFPALLYIETTLLVIVFLALKESNLSLLTRAIETNVRDMGKLTPLARQDTYYSALTIAACCIAAGTFIFVTGKVFAGTCALVLYSILLRGCYKKYNTDGSSTIELIRSVPPPR